MWNPRACHCESNKTYGTGQCSNRRICTRKERNFDKLVLTRGEKIVNTSKTVSSNFLDRKVFHKIVIHSFSFLN